MFLVSSLFSHYVPVPLGSITNVQKWNKTRYNSMEDMADTLDFLLKEDLAIEQLRGFSLIKLLHLPSYIILLLLYTIRYYI